MDLAEDAGIVRKTAEISVIAISISECVQRSGNSRGFEFPFDQIQVCLYNLGSEGPNFGS